MKSFLTTVGLALALVLTALTVEVPAQDTPGTPSTPKPQDKDDSVSFQNFYDKLASQGTWIQTDDYGYVWQPTENDPNWRPYMYGQWVNTDAGLTWDSTEPFGWATYHYGRWVNLDGYGWVWVPGYTWAPAWVSWRSGDDDVGWAPLPPDSDEGIDYLDDDDYFTDGDPGYGFHIGDDCDLAYGIGAGYYNFCPIGYFGDRDAWRHFYPRGDNYRLINRTRNVTNINYHAGGRGRRFGSVTAQGPSIAALNAGAHTELQRMNLTSASNPAGAGLHGDTLAVYAPKIDPATMRTAAPSNVGERLSGAEVNRGTNISQPLAVNSRLSPAAPTGEQVRAADSAQNHAPPDARVATADTAISRPLTQSIASLRVNTGRLGGISSTGQAARIGASTASRSYASFGGNSYGGGYRSEANRGSSGFYPPGGLYMHSQPGFQSGAGFRSNSGYDRPGFGSSGFAAHFQAPSTARFSGGYGSRSSGGGYGGSRALAGSGGGHPVSGGSYGGGGHASASGFSSGGGGHR